MDEVEGLSEVNSSNLPSLILKGQAMGILCIFLVLFHRFPSTLNYGKLQLTTKGCWSTPQR